MPKLKPPKNGVTVRMYRQGHGDCFLLAFPRKGSATKPVYVLIDCGYKPGSPAFVHQRPIQDTVDHIRESTGGRLDLVILTHEHQDHLNGIWKKNNPYFEDFEILEAWTAWTEDPADTDANTLRNHHHDVLLGLIAARRRLALAVGPQDTALRRLDDLLTLEFGGEDEVVSEALLSAAADPAASINKQGLKLVKDKAEKNRGVSYLEPGDGPLPVSEASAVQAFILGPPRDPGLLSDEDPRGTEAFPDDDAHGFTFVGAASAGPAGGSSPFTTKYAIPMDRAFSDDDPFYGDHYGSDSAGSSEDAGAETLDNVAWRRIEDEWLYSAEALALTLNKGINNTSLVVAFELQDSKKVLFFAADAQRGSWVSWTGHTWKDGMRTVTTRDLLGRTVLYKVGHHGSHNATLAGTKDDDYPNLSWMASGAASGEFTAMITAVNEWALNKMKPPWRHPLPSIKLALETKAQGRVFQTDTDEPTKPAGVSDAAWNGFLERTVLDELFFDYTVMDE